MYTMNDYVCRERADVRRRDAEHRRVAAQWATARRWRRRADEAERRAEASRWAVEATARRDYDLAGR